MTTALIVRLNPITNTPVIFDALSARDGQIDAIISGQKKRVGISDYYSKAQPIDRESARTVAKLYAQQANIPEDELQVRDRLPKTITKRPVLNDANLVLVKPEQSQAPAAAPSNLAEFAQALQEEHNRQRGNKQEEQKASPENPEGAVVQQGKQKRRYTKKTEEQSKRSKAAMKRYLEELSQQASQSPTLFEPVKTDAPQPVIDAAILELATALARILKTPGAL